jgi:integrase
MATSFLSIPNFQNMPRGDKSGSIYQLPDGRWCAKKKYRKLDGTEGKKVRICDTERKAQKEFVAILGEIEKELAGPPPDATPAPSIKTFSDLATHFETNYLKPAVWHDDRKVEGMKSYDKQLSTLKYLKQELGTRELRTIDWGDMRDLKSRRLRSPVAIKHRVSTGSGSDRVMEIVIKTRPRSIASVQQPLKLARRMFNIALRLGWMERNPFHCGDPLIILAHEKKRERILSREEEMALYEVCSERLRELTMLAVYTAARENELLTLKLDDIWLDRRMFQIRGRNAKTETRRIVPIFEPVMPIFRRLVAQSETGYLCPPGTREYVDRHFRNACELANIKHFQWRDLRHTGTSRIVRILKNPILAMKVTGHTNYKTFIQVYVNIDEETANEIREKVDAALLITNLWSPLDAEEAPSQKPS